MSASSRPTSTRIAASPLPRAPGVNTQTKILDSGHGRLLCIADIRGRHSGLNDLAREANAVAIIHTGDFGFFESGSLDRINDRALRHLTMYSPLITSAQRTTLLSPENPPASIRATVNVDLLSEFPLLLSGQLKLDVPVYTTWGACEDVVVLEKFRAGTYNVENLHILDEATTRCLDVGGIKLRLLGLGGALVPHKMFDNGEGNATIAGGQGTMWTTALQIGELVDTAQRVFDNSETRLLVTHTSPGREGILAQLSLVVKADLTISAGLHFRYATSYNEFSVQGDFEGFRRKLVGGKEQFDKVWESVKNQVDAVIDDNQRVLLDKALNLVERLPPAPAPTGIPGGTATGEEPAWKNCWNWNLCDAAYGSLILDIKEGRVSAELKSQGFNYAYRRTATVAGTPTSTTPALPPNVSVNSATPAKASTPVPADRAPSAKASSPPPAASSPKANGTSESKADREKQKKKDKKERKDKEKAEKDDGRTAASTPDVSSPASAFKPSVSSPLMSAPGSSKPDLDELKSPGTDGGSGGARTPRGTKPARNPWTIFMRMNVAPTEGEIRDFFADAKAGITKINLPPPFAGRPQRVAYVEFGDEEAMRAALSKHAEKLKDQVPEVMQATDKGDRDGASHRGRGRGGGRGGGFAARGLSAAGLVSKGRGGDGPKSAGAGDS
ncbi:hypothetical protein C8J56DRAFT_789589 [Mycena floridula]|nr:hypothetical protein C8J56DRAFT_789589 [Mycena floridula]